MKTLFHPADERGYGDHDRLQTHHSFSFGDRYDPQKMGFGLLRVLNDDTIAWGSGFGPHPHRDMEIVTIPLEGALQHQDNTWWGGIIRPNDVQVMSAGTGIVHSEMNASQTESGSFLQLRILPTQKGIQPRYDQKAFDEAARRWRFQLVVSNDGREESLMIHQNAFISRGSFDLGTIISYAMHGEHNGVYVFLISWSIAIGDELLMPRDAMGIRETSAVEIEMREQSDVLVIEVPMT